MSRAVAQDPNAVMTPYCAVHKVQMHPGKWGSYCTARTKYGWCKEKPTYGLGATLNTELEPF